MSTIKFPCLPPLRARDLPSFLIVPPDDPTAVVLDMLKGHVRHSRQRARAVEFKTDCSDEHVRRAGGGRTLRCPGPSLDPDRSHSFVVGRSRTRFVQAGREGVHGVAGLEAPRLGRVRVVREHDSLEEGADGGDPERAEGQRAAVLWVLRRECRWEGLELQDDDENGMVVEWCSQVEVLSHPSVGCFVTTAGGTRPSRAWSAECRQSGAAVDGPGDERHAGGEDLGDRSEGEVNEEGVLGREELKKCLDLVMGEGRAASGLRRMWSYGGTKPNRP
ncbi:crocetin glucosyltransferase, chloroplastic-like [Iris pallida]|uniref:Crocetin glucosyltransferase, chloroplastic-like n=1 Tax=Iris pallida TaxID=29817 RepID=A0AAX6EM10_IRIPA|nr:crocetin glucosyltransferase, chloroplastic-like [Iris pallida]